MASSAPVIARSLGRRLRFSQLEMVSEVAAAGSLGEAAARLHISRAAVSKAIKELERTLGQVLFERSRQGMVPTPAGQRVAKHAQLLANDLRQLTEEMAASPASGALPLRIGMPAFVAQHVAPPMLRRLADRGLARVQLHEGRLLELIERLIKGEVDAVLALYAPRAVDGLDLSSLEVRPFLEVPIVVVASPALRVPRRRLRWGQLVGAPWVLPPASTHLRRSVDEMFSASGVAPPAGTIESGSLAANVHLAAQGLGLAAVPLAAAQAEIAARRLHIVETTTVLPPTHVALMYRKVSAIYLDAIRLLDEAVGDLTA